MPAQSLQIAVLQGTSRPGNYTGRVVRLVMDRFQEMPGVVATLFDPGQAELPFPGESETAGREGLRSLVTDADGVMFVTPEYHGGVSSMTKLMIENLGFPSQLEGKPVALLGVAAGRIGAVKSLEQLRIICSHIGAVVLPRALSVAKVRDSFDEDGAVDSELKERAGGFAEGLIEFIREHRCPPGSGEQEARG